MKTKHTPGPWTYDGLGSHFSIFVKDWEDGDRGDIAQVNDKIQYPNETALANARLIAAAPELLMALETIEGAFWTDGEPKSERIADLKSIAAYAIKKATS